MKSQTKILVKVGKTSDITFSHALALRAITLEELKYIADSDSELHIVVIENIISGEEEVLKGFISSFILKNKQNRVFFYVKDNDSVTCGVADELGYDICLTLDELHRTMYSVLNLQVSTNIDYRLSLRPTNTSSGFEAEIEESDSNDGFDSDIKEGFPEVPENEPGDAIFEPSEVVETSSVDNTSSSSTTTKDTPVSKSNAINITKDKTENTNTVKSDPDDRVAKLEKAVRTLLQEKELMQKEFNKLLESGDYLEEPVSAEIYKKILAENDAAIEKIEDLKAGRAQLEEQIRALQRAAEDKETEIADLKFEISDYKRQNKALSDSIASGEAFEEQVEVYKARIRKLESQMAPLNETIKNINNTVSDLAEQLEEKTIRVEFEVGSRLKIMEILLNTMRKFKQSTLSLEEYKKSLEAANSELSKLKSQNEKKEGIIASQSKEILELKSLESSIDAKIATAVASERAKVAVMAEEKEDIEKRIKIVQEQLRIKEKQYQEALQKGAGGIGNEALTNINNTLKKANNELQNRLLTLQRKYAELETRSSLAVNNYSVLEEQNKSLQNIINSSTGETGTIVLPPLNYRGKARIYTVLGSGSYGVTTTAVSLVNRLTGKSLFIDFDFATPRADVKLATMPWIQNVPELRNMTGVTAFFLKGLDTFKKYYPDIVKNSARTKNGSTDCLCGSHIRPTRKQFINADLQGFLNFLGSLYDNIVIDLGKLGSSDMTDQIAKVLCGVSSATMLITSNNDIDIRMFRRRISNVDIRLDKSVWIANQCRNTSISKELASVMNPIKKCYIVPIDSELIMAFNKTFFHGAMTKAKFTLILQEMGVVTR